METGMFKSFAAAALLAAPAALAEDYQVERSIEIASSPEIAWEVVGDFCDLDDWHPQISGCSLKVIDGGLHRILTFADGGEVIEKRIAAEPGLSYTYSIVSSTLPLDRYTATLSITRGEPSTITWSGRFASEDPAAEGMIAGFYEAGLAAVEARLAQ